ncbi:ribosome maturation factor RimP [Kibdelosporangium philippinense]|uniref:Ribosome maturation factor RimP n=1 Tax=Kibdelosporangium philippinense TaxID=211113 RepID=A0ABS8ZKF3_9PSEU|nr:ribosome maturation factor RimP [Kibdelosporangium philippinense]MCE7007618.1 ribosome maturation factor RimP [Kibdelosporangium philippinense]
MANQQGDLGAALEPVVRDAVGAAGFELEQLEVQRAGRRSLVKVVVDGENGIELDEVAGVSRTLATVLDDHDHVLGGPYTLEVTSPGLDRPLTKPRHWRRARLRLVKVRTADETFTGRVGDASENDVRMLVAGELRQVPFDAVDHAVIEVEFKQPPPDELAALGGGSQEGAR